MIPHPDETSLMILDCISHPRESLAIDAEGTKAICSALTDISWFSDYIFLTESNLPDPVKMKVIEVNANLNSCSNQCNFTVEIKYEHSYTRKEILNTIRKHTRCKFTVRENLSDLDPIEGGVINNLL